MTGFAVAWGIFILVALLGVSNGLQNGMQAMWGNKLSNSCDIWAMWTSKPYNGLPSGRELYFSRKQSELIRQMPETELFSCVVSSSMETVFGTEASNISIKGVEGDYQKIMNKDIAAGRFINDRDQAEETKVAVLDQRALEELKTSAEEVIGKHIRIGGINFLVVGVCENGDRWEEATAHIPFSTHQRIFSVNHLFSNMSVTFRSGTDSLEHRVKNLLAPSMQFDPTDSQAVGVWSQEEAVKEQNKAMSAIRLFILILGLCTLTSGAVGVSNIMLVSVRERTKELGIRKALGAPPSTVMLSVIGEALAITGLFGIIGLGIGAGFIRIIKQVMSYQQGDFANIFQNPNVDMGIVSIALIILIAVGVIAGAIPASKAMKVRPIEAMNAEK